MGVDDVALRHAPWVAYVGPFAFPNGGAAARRILGNAQSLVDAGYRVVVASGQGSGWPQGTEYKPGISVVSLGERTAEHWPRPLRRLRYAGMGRGARAWLASQRTKPSAVILYSGYTPYLLRLTSWCRRHSIPLIFEAVEWYEPPSTVAGLLSPYQWNIEFAMRWLIKRVDGVIAISDYLAAYYRRAGRPVVSIPPTLDVAEIATHEKAAGHRPLQLCYAGSPGRNKDLLEPIMDAVLRLDPEGGRMVLHVAGLGAADVLAYAPLSSRGAKTLPGCIRAHGTLPHPEALALVRHCDFSVLLRPSNRVSRAGFSTKFVESLAVGTPVIGNLTGDLGSYLEEGLTGLVCADASHAEALAAVQRALTLREGQLHAMRQRCRQVASERFDYRAYSTSLSAFLGALSP